MFAVNHDSPSVSVMDILRSCRINCGFRPARKLDPLSAPVQQHCDARFCSLLLMDYVDWLASLGEHLWMAFTALNNSKLGGHLHMWQLRYLFEPLPLATLLTIYSPDRYCITISWC